MKQQKWMYVVIGVMLIGGVGTLIAQTVEATPPAPPAVKPAPATQPADARPMCPRNPLMASLDANNDGELSAEEIANAASVIKKLDKDGDGKLTRQEFLPVQPKRLQDGRGKGGGRDAQGPKKAGKQTDRQRGRGWEDGDGSSRGPGHGQKMRGSYRGRDDFGPGMRDRDRQRDGRGDGMRERGRRWDAGMCPRRGEKDAQGPWMKNRGRHRGERGECGKGCPMQMQQPCPCCPEMGSCCPKMGPRRDGWGSGQYGRRDWDHEGDREQNQQMKERGDARRDRRDNSWALRLFRGMRQQGRMDASPRRGLDDFFCPGLDNRCPAGPSSDRGLRMGRGVERGGFSLDDFFREDGWNRLDNDSQRSRREQAKRGR